MCLSYTGMTKLKHSNQYVLPVYKRFLQSYNSLRLSTLTRIKITFKTYKGCNSMSALWALQETQIIQTWYQDDADKLN
jgi:hypothetical protein